MLSTASTNSQGGKAEWGAVKEKWNEECQSEKESLAPSFDASPPVL